MTFALDWPLNPNYLSSIFQFCKKNNITRSNCNLETAKDKVNAPIALGAFRDKSNLESHLLARL